MLYDSHYTSFKQGKPRQYAEIKQMAFYLVRAKPRKELLEKLREEMNSDKISKLSPFGQTLQHSLENARIDSDHPDYVEWIEEDYCSPPLAMERESVLDRYFDDITVEQVASAEEGWASIKNRPRLWDSKRS